MNLIMDDTQSNFDDDEEEELIMFLNGVLHYNSIRERSYLTRSANNWHCNSPWTFLLNSGDSSSFLNCCGMDKETFYRLKYIIWPEGDIVGFGRPWTIDLDGKLL